MLISKSLADTNLSQNKSFDSYDLIVNGFSIPIIIILFPNSAAKIQKSFDYTKCVIRAFFIQRKS